MGFFCSVKKALLSILFVLAAIAASAQQRAYIKGIVTDAATGEPLIGTTILVEGTSLATASDGNGEFTISNITPGAVSLVATYLGYEIFRRDMVVRAGDQIVVEIELVSEGVSLEEVVVTAQIDHESENVVLSEQRNALVALQTVGAREMSRKGISDAQGAVAQISGISKQEGVKNVFVRGLGDRYNATYLNGFPLPSEDPEYKNIALEFFGSDIIQNIGVNKVFNSSNGGDVGGAVIDIRSKELIGRQEFSVSLDGGVNSEVVSTDKFLKLDGVNYFGMSRTQEPAPGKFDFANSLDPSKVSLPLNHSYSISGGKRWEFGEQKNPLSFFVVASHSSDYSFTDEIVRDATAGDMVTEDRTGQKSTIDINQLVLANVDLKLNRKHNIAYNFMLIHANEQSVGDYFGTHTNSFEDAYGDEMIGFMRRQQSNDNLLVTHQLITKWTLGEKWDLSVGGAYNKIKGTEPDRRSNKLSRWIDGEYRLTAGNDSQQRFFSELNEDDLNVKAALRWKISTNKDIDRSNLTIGYRGRFVEDSFGVIEYNMTDYSALFTLEDLKLDNYFNSVNYEAGEFDMDMKDANRYSVKKNLHSAYLEATQEFSPRLSVNLGVQVDYVDLTVDYNVETVPPGTETIDKFYALPSFNIKYDVADKHSLRLGASKSYTLPQSKEIAPYQYINVGFISEGNHDLKPSDNYNVDLKWDWYPSSSEIISLGGFYKYIANPIGRVQYMAAARILSYANISDKANVAGLELEVRKNIINTTTARQNMRRLSAGMNASYIYSNMDFGKGNNQRRTGLEAASPLLINGDLSYNWSSGSKSFTAAVVVNYFSDRIYALGSYPFKDTIEEGLVTLDIVSSFKVNKNWTVKLKAGNLIDPVHRLTREYVTKPGVMTLSEYRKGMDISVGVTFEL